MCIILNTTQLIVNPENSKKMCRPSVLACKMTIQLTGKQFTFFVKGEVECVAFKF